MDLDGGNARQLQRVANRVAVVRPRARVDDRPVGDLAQAVEALYELTLVVGLKERRLETELASVLLDLELELGKGDRTVVLRRALAEPVEVDPVQDLDPVVRDYVQRSSSTA